jgi:hypothetical protein
MAQEVYYLRPLEAAAYLKISTSALAKKRISGDGPTFVRWGKAIRYRRGDLDAYMTARLSRSTSEEPNVEPTSNETVRYLSPAGSPKSRLEQGRGR